MKLSIPATITLDFPAQKVWAIVAHDFENIGHWASQIPKSTPNREAAPIDGAPISGRVCETNVPGFSAISESFTYYNEEEMRFKYEVTNGLPIFMQAATNDWQVRSVDENRSELEINGEVTLKPWAFFLFPMFKMQLSRTGKLLLEELQHYIQHGEPHPRVR